MKILLWVSAVFFLLAAWVKYVEWRNMYFPAKEIEATCDSIGLLYEEVFLTTSDNKKICGWFIPSGNAKFTLIFCHGNAGNISHRLDKIAIFHSLGLNVFIFDYRGYGKSEGTPSEIGLYRDADAAYNYIIKERKIPKEHIIVYGESLGGAVAIELAEKEAAGALITEDAFTSVRDMAKVIYPFIPGFLISDRFKALSKIGNVSSPKLIIHSVNDDIVPFYLGEKLFNAANPPKTLLKIHGSHNTAFLDSEEKFTEGIRSFLSEVRQ